MSRFPAPQSLTMATENLSSIKTYLDEISMDEGGVSDFFWPYTPPEIQERIFTWVKRVSDIALEYKGQKIRPNDVLSLDEKVWINFLKWQPVLVQALQTSILFHSCNQNNRNFEWDRKTMPFWAAYAQNEVLPDNRYLKALLSGPVPDQEWKWPARWLQNVVKGKAIKRLPSFLYRPSKDLTLTFVCEATEKYCHQQEKRPVYQPLSKWFSGIDEADILSLPDHPAIQAILEVSFDLIRSKAPLEKNMQEWVSRQIRLSMHAVEILSSRILADLDHNPLPSYLIPNISEPWAIIFRYLTFKNGGHVTVFDHGCGSALSIGHQSCLGYIYGAHEFKTYSNFAGQSFWNHIPEPFKSLVKDCKIEGADVLQTAYTPVEPPQNKTILFVPFYDMRDHDLSFAYPSWIQALDFNKKLISDLKGLGYDVIMKPHPSFYHLPKDKGEEVFGCSYSLSPFEDIVDDAHLIVTCDPHSTTIIACILKQKPILVFDYGSYDYPDLNKNIKERMEMVEIQYDEENRMIYSKENLESQIQSALHKKNIQSMHQLFFNKP